MLNKLYQAGAWLVAIVLAVFWLRRDAKADAKAEADSAQKGEVIDRVKKANDVAKKVNADTSDNRRKRLRQRNK